jgi:hypothetical protein
MSRSIEQYIKKTKLEQANKGKKEETLSVLLFFFSFFFYVGLGGLGANIVMVQLSLICCQMENYFSHGSTGA